MSQSIAVIDVRDMQANTDRVFGTALETHGFAIIVNHGVPQELIADAYRVAAQVFALPLKAKRAYETPKNGRQTGYSSFGVEHAKDHVHGDLKEFWHVMRPGNGLAENLFPTEVAEFERVSLRLFSALEQLSILLLGSIGRFLEKPTRHFESMIANGNSVLRFLHYPEIDGSVQGVRSAPHEDINLLTLLVAGTKPGLELMDRDGSWIEVDAPPGAIIANAADMLQLHTFNRLRSATHRVVNPLRNDGGRYSMPFFTHPRSDVPLVVAKDYLFHRLREIGVMV